MKTSLRIGRLAGIDVYAHITFLLLLTLIGVSDVSSGGLKMMVSGLVTILVVFTIIVLHELGHALAARRYGIQTERITLLPIGGVASIDRIPEDPRQELVVAIAGPAVNVLLAGLTLAVIGIDWHLRGGLLQSDIVSRFLWTNIILAVFNMIPAFPMDGGRVFRALLSLFIDRSLATHYASLLGQGFAVLFGILGLFVNPMLILIAIFIWSGAKAEEQDVRFRALVRGVTVREVVSPQTDILDIEDSLATAAKIAEKSLQTLFPVVEHGQVVGVVTSEEIIRTMISQGSDASLRQARLGAVLAGHPDEQLSDLFESVVASNVEAIVAIEGGAVVGICPISAVGEHLTLHSLQGQSGRTTGRRNHGEPLTGRNG